MSPNTSLLLRVLFWLSLAAAVAGLLWYMTSVPGASYRGALPALGPVEREIEANLRRHVQTIGAREHNLEHPQALEDAARYIEGELAALGYAVSSQRFTVGAHEVRNIEAERRGASRADEIVLIGAHYDSVSGAPGANDNGSGVAAVLELARLMRGASRPRTVRFVLFVNEEPPYFKSEAMGSARYARRSRERGENVVAMFSLETLGYYSDRPGSQRYPFPLSFFYPSEGNFVAFVSNLGSRRLLHEAIAAFRRHAAFPSEGVAAPAFIPGVDWSDQWSFWREGYAAVMLTDTAPYRYPAYHTARDTPEQVDTERLARVVLALRGMFGELGGEEEPPQARRAP